RWKQSIPYIAFVELERVKPMYVEQQLQKDLEELRMLLERSMTAQGNKLIASFIGAKVVFERMEKNIIESGELPTDWK
ncbi:hypothetical protein, partial [Streptomyces sp. JV178]|uniref:hypothetical protein n=1 Tax=Streptomyces sp. JV178 TaxID=858632 RepID=UPI001C55683F